MSNTKIDSKYKTMFSDYPDVVTVAQLRKMLGISVKSKVQLPSSSRKVLLLQRHSAFLLR